MLGATGQWNRATASGAATNGGTYHPRFSFEGSSSASYAFDDIIIYTSTSAGVDLTAPNAASALSALDNGTDIELTWTDGEDAAADISGIEGTLIIRIAGDHTGSIPTPQPQTWYSTNSGIGPTTIVNGANTWTVLSNGAASGTHTDAGASGSDYTYVVYMRDKAFNYSAGTAIYCNNCTSFCTVMPAPGNTLVDDATPCIGDNIILSLQNTTPGNGVAYQWQRASNAAFTAGLIDLGTSSTQLTTAVTGTVYYRCQVTCSASSSTGISTAVAVTGQTCYCSSGATETNDGRIQRVRFNTIDQTSPNTCQTYTDYTAVSTTVVPGSVYNLIINQGTCSANTGHQVRAWVDFNGDGIFSDPAERVFDANMGSFDPLEVSQTVNIPYTAVGGPTGMRVVSRVGTSSNPQPCGTYNRGETEDYTVNICDMVWNGGTTAWGTASNWSCGVLPTSLNNVTIPTTPSGGNQPTVNVVSATARDISVQPNATVTISSGNALTVHGDLTNNGTVTVQNNGSLVQVEGSGYSGSGTCNVQRQGTSSGTVYNYWSSPVVAGVIPGGNRYQYHSPSGTLDNIDDNAGSGDPGWQAYSGPMTPGRGYASTGGGLANFSGPVNNGNVDYQVLNPSPGTPFNLIGNPFPSAISADAFIGLNGPSAIPGANNRVSGALYFWDDDQSGSTNFWTDDYAVWTRAGATAGSGSSSPSGQGIGLAPTGNISSGQGFFVRTLNTGTVTFRNSMRGDNNTQFFRLSEEDNEVHRLWLSIRGNGHFNQMLVVFREDGSEDEHLVYDARKVRGNQHVSLSAVRDNGVDYTIMALPPLADEELVPLRVQVSQSGDWTFVADSLEGFNGFDVYLEDMLTGYLHPLQQGGTVSVYVTPTDMLGRFRLRFSPQLITGLISSELWTPTFYCFERKLYLSSSKNVTASLRVIDMSGRSVLERVAVSLGQDQNIIDVNHLSSGLYTISLEGDSGLFTRKIMLQ